jgi:hypothetical protein
MRGVCIGLAAVAVVFALAPAALAQSSGAGYGGQGGGVEGQVAPGGPAGGAAGGGGNVASQASNPNQGGLLAFTGLDVALIVGGGLVLLAGGVALSRMVARNPA